MGDGLDSGDREDGCSRGSTSGNGASSMYDCGTESNDGNREVDCSHGNGESGSRDCDREDGFSHDSRRESGSIGDCNREDDCSRGNEESGST